MRTRARGPRPRADGQHALEFAARDAAMAHNSFGRRRGRRRRSIRRRLAAPAVEDHRHLVLRCLRTCSAVVGEMRPEGLALGATTGSPAAFRVRAPWMGRHSECRWNRVRRWPEAKRGGQGAGARHDELNGPGQKASASLRASASNTPSRKARLGIGHMGDERMKAGRPLAA